MSSKALPLSVRLLSQRREPRLASLRQSCRNFSSTPACGIAAVFKETENGQLNDTLKQIQEKIIFPAYLPDKQRRLVFDPKLRGRLRENPVVIEVEGVEHRFPPIDMFKDIPNSKRIMFAAIENMWSREEWENLATLLYGYRKAGVHLQQKHRARLIRKAGSRRNIHAIIQCAQQANQTNFVLREPECVVLTLMYVAERALPGESELGQPKQALSWTESVLDMLRRPPHEAYSQKLLFSRAVMGLALYPRAVAIQAKQAAGEDIDQDLILLQDEMELLTSLWAAENSATPEELADYKLLRPHMPRDKSLTPSQIPGTLGGSSYVKVLAFSIKGIAVTRELLGNDEILKGVDTALDKHLDEFVQSAKATRRGWDKSYEKIMERTPSWAELCDAQQPEEAIAA